MAAGSRASTRWGAARWPGRWLQRPSCFRTACHWIWPKLLDDSKRLTAEQRNVAYAALLASGLADIGVGAASVSEISRINILRASLLAMRRAVARLSIVPDLALVDGNQAPPLPCPVRCVIGGDAACLSIAAASIVAKVVRDRAMRRLAVRLPAYGWHSQCRVWHRGAPGGHCPARAIPPSPPDLRRGSPAPGGGTGTRHRLTRLPGVCHIDPTTRRCRTRGNRPRTAAGPSPAG